MAGLIKIRHVSIYAKLNCPHVQKGGAFNPPRVSFWGGGELVLKLELALFFVDDE